MYPCQAGNPDDWFDKPGTEVTRKAKTLCFQQCPIVHQCALLAIEGGIEFAEFGVWGGLDEQDRKRIWSRKGQAA